MSHYEDRCCGPTATAFILPVGSSAWCATVICHFALCIGGEYPVVHITTELARITWKKEKEKEKAKAKAKKLFHADLLTFMSDQNGSRQRPKP